MSDKIIKVEQEIVAGSTAALDRALAEPSQLTSRSITSRPHRWPKPGTLCRTCNHTYSTHNYSDSLVGKGDPLGFMYECNGGIKGTCGCKKFELPPLFTSDGACLNDSFMDHNCPGFEPLWMMGTSKWTGSESDTIFCECTCSNCLTKTRSSMMLLLSTPTPPYEIVNDNCISFAHDRCTVVRDYYEPPVVCPCDCIDCLRLWHWAGRPIVRDGKIIKMRVE